MAIAFDVPAAVAANVPTVGVPIRSESLLFNVTTYEAASTEDPFVFNITLIGFELEAFVLQTAGGFAKVGSITGSGFIGTVIVKGNPTQPVPTAVGVIV
jgi:hypothetical protein